MNLDDFKAKLEAAMEGEFAVEQVSEMGTGARPSYVVMCEPIPAITCSWGAGKGQSLKIGFCVPVDELDYEGVLDFYVQAVRAHRDSELGAR